MKNLVVVTLFAVMLLSAQTPKVEPGLLLTEVETLQISVMMKDVLLVNQRIQILQAQFEKLVIQRHARQAEYLAMVERLRIAHKAPADKFTFDSATLRFVPLPTKEPAK